MPENRHLRFLLILFYITLGILGVVVLLYAFKYLLPFLIAFIIASMLNRPTAKLAEALRIPRGFASIIMVVFTYGILGTGLGFLIAFLLGQFQAFSAELPAYVTGIMESLETLWAEFTVFINGLPTGIRTPLLSLISNVSIPTIDAGSMVGTVKSVAFSIPTILIFMVALLMSTFYILCDYSRILAFIKAQLPQRILESIVRLKQHLSTTVGRWLRAMGIIIFITFVELCIGFLLLGIDYAILIAALVALIDALPVFGTGTVLIPWAAYQLLMGNYSMAIYIALLYATVTIIRNFIEPRILGDHIGLNPLVMLICFYLGFRTMGLMGMFVLPFLLICLDKLQEWGYIRLWRKPQTAPESLPKERVKRKRHRKNPG